MLLDAFARSVGAGSTRFFAKNFVKEKKSLYSIYSVARGLGYDAYVALRVTIDSLGQMDLPTEDKTALYVQEFKKLRPMDGMSLLGVVMYSPLFYAYQRKQLFRMMLENGLNLELFSTPCMSHRSDIDGSAGFSSLIPTRSVLHSLAKEYATDAESVYGFSPFETFMEHVLCHKGGGTLLRTLFRYDAYEYERDGGGRQMGLIRRTLLDVMTPEGQAAMQAFCHTKGLVATEGVQAGWLRLPPTYAAERQCGFGF